MPRAIWSGSISFGLLNVPVKLYSAVSSKRVSFRELRASDGSRVRHKRVAEADGISARSLQKLFAAAGQNFSTYLRTRRLERCRLDSDPARRAAGVRLRPA